jgi:hypothetical protein
MSTSCGPVETCFHACQLKPPHSDCGKKCASAQPEAEEQAYWACTVKYCWWTCDLP